jgi:hypothetical protein
LDPRSPEAQLEDQKPKKSSKGHLEEGKTAKPTNGKKSGKPKKSKENLKTSNSKLPPETNSP